MDSVTIALPDRLLLATDLSTRCDRALDRAAQLAKAWQAELIAINVLDAAASPDQALAWAAGMGDAQLGDFARQLLVRDLQALDIRVRMQVVRSGDAAEAIGDAAARNGCGLVVTGVASNEAFGRFLLGSTVQRLARSLPQPLLVVRRRPHGAYRRVAVATDLSDSSRHALLTAARLFPACELVVFHAWQAPGAGLANNQQRGRAGADAEAAELLKFVAASRLPAEARVLPVVEHGTLESTLTRYVRNHDIDLVVMGSHGRSGVLSILLGSSAARLLEWLPCDAMVVRDPRLAA